MGPALSTILPRSNRRPRSEAMMKGGGVCFHHVEIKVGSCCVFAAQWVQLRGTKVRVFHKARKDGGGELGLMKQATKRVFGDFLAKRHDPLRPGLVFRMQGHGLGGAKAIAIFQIGV